MLRWIAALAFSCFALGANADAPRFPDLPKGSYVVVCKIDREIDDGMAVVVERAVREAADAAGIVFVVDTPGGRVDSAINITKHILGAKCPTVAYLSGMGAISAGALISYACDEIVMDPTSNIGASTPIMPGTETTPAMDEKSNSFVRAKYRALGEKKGHNPLLGEAMVDTKIELRGRTETDGRYTIVKTADGNAADLEGAPLPPRNPLANPADLIESLSRNLLGEKPKPAPRPAAPLAEPSHAVDAEGMEMISPRGSLLTLTPQEAVKYGLAKAKVESLDAALALKNWDKLTRHDVTPRWDEALYAFLINPIISGLLLMCGIGGLYLEFKTPGSSLPGLIGILCLAIFFGAHLVVGMAEWLDVVLFVLGVVLLAVDLFFITSIALGVAGVISILAGIYHALTHVGVPEYSWEYARTNEAAQTLIVSMLALTALIVLTWKLLPRTPLWGRFANEYTEGRGAGYVAQDLAAAHAAIGMRGVTTSMLRPAGRGRFAGKTYDIVTQGDYLPEGTAVEIIESDGNRYVVAAVKEGSGHGHA